MVCIKSKHSNNINKVRKKGKAPSIIIITKRKLNIIIPVKVQLGTSISFG